MIYKVTYKMQIFKTNRKTEKITTTTKATMPYMCTWIPHTKECNYKQI